MVRIGFITCTLLIGLRLAIGWHVTYEGFTKYESSKRGKSDISRPFSSQGYFAEAEGPLGPKMREWLGDADQTALAKLRLKESDDDKPYTKMPEALEKEWDDYARQFETYFKLTDEEKKQAALKLLEAKTKFVQWRTDTIPEKEREKKDDERKPAVSVVAIGQTFIYRGDYPVMRRCLIYDQVVREIRHAYEIELPKMGRDVEKARLRELKNKAAEIRADLMKEVDGHTIKLRESLAKVVSASLAGVDFGKTDDAGIDDRVLAMLSLSNGGMPAELEKQWNHYHEFVRVRGNEKYRNDPQRSDDMLTDAKTRYVRYLTEKDEYSGATLNESEKENGVGKRLELYRAAVQKVREARKNMEAEPSTYTWVAFAALVKEPVAYRQAFMDDIRRHTDVLRQNLGGFVSEKDVSRRLDPERFQDEAIPFDNLKGTIRPEKESTRFLWIDWPATRLEWMNWATRWGLLIGGLCILFGLFTRLACFGVAMFLLTEILLNTPLPWLPTSPKSEGSYAFVNKNTVEMLALLVLATLPTGRWFGLDALLSCIWPFRRRTRPERA